MHVKLFWQRILRLWGLDHRRYDLTCIYIYIIYYNAHTARHPVTRRNRKPRRKSRERKVKRMFRSQNVRSQNRKRKKGGRNWGSEGAAFEKGTRARGEETEKGAGTWKQTQGTRGGKGKNPRCQEGKTGMVAYACMHASCIGSYVPMFVHIL